MAETPPITDTKDPSKPKRKQRGFRLFAGALAVVVFWGIPELVVRLMDVPVHRFKKIVFGGDETSRLLFMQDPQVGWTPRPNFSGTFLEHDVDINAAGLRGSQLLEDRRTVLCLGDSTTFGWRVRQSESFPAVLGQRLTKTAGPNSWQVLNAGVPGYSSRQVQLQAAQLIPLLEPDVVVICIGNNDRWAVRSSDAERIPDKSAASMTRRLLASSHFISLLAEQFSSNTTATFEAPDLKDSVPRVATNETEKNIRSIIELAQRHKCRVIVLSPTVNLYRIPGDTEQPGWDEFRSQFDHLQTLVAQQRVDESQQYASELFLEHKNDFRYVWMQGMSKSISSVEDGYDTLQQAFDMHPFPGRCPNELQAVIAKTSQACGADYANVNLLFQQDTAPDPPITLYQDQCHPTAAGHLLIAELLLPMIAK